MELRVSTVRGSPAWRAQRAPAHPGLHTIGLLSLRESAGFRVWAPPAVVTALAPLRDIVDHYHEWEWLAVDAGLFDVDGLRSRPFPLHDKPPRYAARHAGLWGVAYRFEDAATGSTRT